MKLHEIKLESCFCADVISGRKSFELRKNDRDYKVGDLVRFIPINISADTYIAACVLQGKTFEIKYIIAGYGLKDGYVVFAIEPVEIVRKDRML